MKCQRCGGIMAPEEFYGPDDMFSGWRCIFCGEIIDPVILHNRGTKKPPAVLSRARIRHYEILSLSDGRAPYMSEWIQD